MSVFHVEFDFNLSVWFESDQICFVRMEFQSDGLSSKFIRKSLWLVEI